MALIAENGGITVAELVEKVGVSEKTVKRIIRQLREANKIYRIGSNRMGVWKIVKRKESELVKSTVNGTVNDTVKIGVLIKFGQK